MKMKTTLEDSFFGDIIEVEDELPRFKTFLAGRWTRGFEWLEVRTPIDNSIVGYVPKLSTREIDEALRLIYEQGKWDIRNTPGYRRVEIMNKIADLMEKHIDTLVESLVYTAGKTYPQARGEVAASISRLRDSQLDARKIMGEYLAGDWDKSTLETEGIVRKEPYGVVLAIVPFNYPLFDTVAKFTYSAVAGNAVVVKPPSADPVPILLFAKIVEESGFPKTAFSVLTIPGREMERVVSDKRISVISFTGSSNTGKQVLRVGGVKQYIMELGGGDPAIVFSDADIQSASKLVASGIYSYAGQRCDAIKLILVERDIYDEFKKLLVGELSRVKVGDPRNPDTTMGPLISREAVDQMLEAVEDALGKGGILLYGGRRLGDNYVEPTLIEIQDHSSLVKTRLYSEEIFAPIALVTSFDTIREAVELANGRGFGLDLAVFGTNIDKIRYVARYAEVGAIYVNDMPRHGVGYYPFGGRKDSGIGREGIGYSVEYVMATKTIIFNFKGKGIYHYLT